MFSANTSQVSNDVKYIEDFFSAWLRTGTGSSQTVTTGIKENTGALVISKSRSAATDWAWYDTFRGATKDLVSNSTAAETTQSQGLTAFNTDGHTWGTLAKVNTSGATYVDFVLKPTPKFFDVVTYTGNGSNRTISHSLGSVPGCIIIKRTDTTGAWAVYHRSLANTQYMVLNTTAAKATGATYWNSTTPTSTVFSLGTATDVNANTGTYVAYLFAHDAGGFGTAGTDNVISCGSYTASGTSTTVTLGYEPQWVLIKKTNVAGDNWRLLDTMRGMTVAGSTKYTLAPNTSAAEESWSDAASPSATGFTVDGAGLNDGGDSYIYIAIRRGPMKTPTSGTSVFESIASSASTGTAQTTGFPVDMQIAGLRTVAGSCDHYVDDRLRGVSSTTTEQGRFLKTNATDAEATGLNLTRSWGNTGFQIPSDLASVSAIYWNFRRAPGFFDEVCYTGNSVNGRTVTHNLGVAPELMIVKNRTDAENWAVYAAPLGASKALYLNQTFAAITDSGQGWWGYPGVNPTATVFTLGNDGTTNSTPRNYVAYLFASCPGVSKVGSYAGTGATQTISCGFAARFVLIKRTNSTGSWFVWDTARGMVAGTDPRLALNSTAAETNANWVYTDASGFQIVTTDATVNASGGTYLYLAIS